MAGDTELTVLREVADSARVDPGARVGVFSTVGPEAVVGAGTVVGRRATIGPRVRLGRDNVVGDGCVLGAMPQDLKYRGSPTLLIIGDRNRFAPDASVQLGTEHGGYLTRIADDVFMDKAAHVAHDCHLDDKVRLGPCVLLAGHVRVETGATIEESCGAHHFTTIGAFSRVGARTPVRRDVPPFAYFTSFGFYTAAPAPHGTDEEGMARAGLAEAEKDELRRALRHLFEDEQALAVKVAELLARPDLPAPLRRLGEFCRRSLSGQFGRYRERFRGRMPPEAARHLPAEFLAGLPEAQREAAP